MNILNFMKKFEDDNHPLLGPNLFALSIAGISLRPDASWLKITIILIPMFSLFTAAMFANLFSVLDDEDKTIENVHLIIPMLLGCVKGWLFVYLKNKLIRIVNIISSLEKLQIKMEDTETLTVMSSYINYSRRLTFCYCVFMFFSMCLLALCYFLQIFVMFMQGKLWIEETPSVFSTKYPFDKTLPPGFYIGTLYDILNGYYSTIIHGSWDTFVVTLMIFFAGQFRLLKSKCSRMFDGDVVVSRARMLECYKHHLFLIKCARKINGILNPIMFFYFVVCSISIGAIALKITRNKEDIVMILSTAEILILVILQLLLFYWHSNEILLTSKSIIDGALDSNWFNFYDRNLRKEFLIFLIGLKVPMVFSAGPFHSMTTSTFIMTLKAAYSYFALLNNKPIR